MYFPQQRHGFSSEARYYRTVMRTFSGMNLAIENALDATTLLTLRRLLIAHELTRTVFDEIELSRDASEFTGQRQSISNVHR
ncbi:IS5 family transposase [Paraburkholderia bannensis]|uniref:IS5 family transposase n=1 Tax=Paraburkholderia bannensis TaxID=765414 RepID=A0A7W9WUZ7_9BURK|nr:IS5 family transposase [Paraburkholderia sp. WP4_3_2]MBB6104891.1 IS5 family transposase [Paraburkholderia bannensis]